MTCVLREVGFGTAADALVQLTETAQNVFARLQAQGAKGTGLRKLVQSFAKSAKALAESGRATEAEKENAYALLYDSTRPELSSDDRVPAWLLNQIKQRVYEHISAVGRLQIEAEVNPPLLIKLADAAVFVAKESAKNAGDLADKARKALLPTWALVLGGGALFVLGLVAIKTYAPRHLAPASITGVPSKGRRGRRRRK